MCQGHLTSKSRVFKKLLGSEKRADSQLDVDSAEYRSTNKITRLSSLVTFRLNRENRYIHGNVRILIKRTEKTYQIRQDSQLHLQVVMINMIIIIIMTVIP